MLAYFASYCFIRTPGCLEYYGNLLSYLIQNIGHIFDKLFFQMPKIKGLHNLEGLYVIFTNKRKIS